MKRDTLTYWISALRLTLWNLRRGNFIPPWRRTSRVVWRSWQSSDVERAGDGD